MESYGFKILLIFPTNLLVFSIRYVFYTFMARARLV